VELFTVDTIRRRFFTSDIFDDFMLYLVCSKSSSTDVDLDILFQSDPRRLRLETFEK
jgi:hypothetical protein